MAFVMSSVDLYFLTKELSIILKDAKVDQIYHPSQLTLKIRFYCPGAGKREIFFAAPQAIYDGSEVSIDTEHDGFCAYLRKNLTGLKILGIKQLGFNRILSLSIGKASTNEEMFQLIFEFFDKGNIVLVENGVIKSVAQIQNWAARQMKANQPYIAPDVQFPNTIDAEKWDEIQHNAFTQEPTLTISKFLATKLSLGGTYATMLCEHAKIDGNILLSTVTKEQQESLQVQTKELFEAVIKPVIIKDETNTTVAIVPNESFISSSQKLKQSEHVDSLLKAYATLFGVAAMQVKKKEATKVSDAARKKITVILDAQEKQLTTLDEEYAESQKIGEHIYENFQELESLMDDLKHQMSESSQKDLKAKLPIKKKSYEVTAIDFANKKITVKHVS